MNANVCSFQKFINCVTLAELKCPVTQTQKSWKHTNAPIFLSFLESEGRNEVIVTID